MTKTELTIDITSIQLMLNNQSKEILDCKDIPVLVKEKLTTHNSFIISELTKIITKQNG